MSRCLVRKFSAYGIKISAAFKNSKQTKKDHIWTLGFVCYPEAEKSRNLVSLVSGVKVLKKNFWRLFLERQIQSKRYVYIFRKSKILLN